MASLALFKASFNRVQLNSGVSLKQGLGFCFAEERARAMGLDMRNVKWIESQMLSDSQGHIYNGKSSILGFWSGQNKDVRVKG